MQIHTTARHCELDSEVREFAQQRLERFSKFARDLTEAHLIVTAEGYRHSAEITLKLKGRDIISREESPLARMAIDLAADRVEQQLRRYKERRIDRSHGRSPNGKATNGTANPDGSGEAIEFEEE